MRNVLHMPSHNGQHAHRLQASITRLYNEKPRDSLHVVTTRFSHLLFQGNAPWSDFRSAAVFLRGFRTSLRRAMLLFSSFFSIVHFGLKQKRKTKWISKRSWESNAPLRYISMSGKGNEWWKLQILSVTIHCYQAIATLEFFPFNCASLFQKLFDQFIR